MRNVKFCMLWKRLTFSKQDPGPSRRFPFRPTPFYLVARRRHVLLRARAAHNTGTHARTCTYVRLTFYVRVYILYIISLHATACNNLPQPHPYILVLGGCRRLLHALTPPHSTLLYLQFLARCHPYILLHF